MLLETRVGDSPVVDIAESTKTKNLWTSAVKLCAFACLCIVLVLSPEVRALLLDPEAAVLASCLLPHFSVAANSTGEKEPRFSESALVSDAMIC